MKQMKRNEEKKLATFRSCRWRRSSQSFYSAIRGRACGVFWYIVILIFTRLLADTTRGGYALYNERAAMSNREKSKLENGFRWLVNVPSRRPTST